MSEAATGILEARGLCKDFTSRRAGTATGRRARLPWRRSATIHAVDDVSLTLYPGTITALVGESGSGKSTIARLLARLSPPTEGDIVFRGRQVPARGRRRDVRSYRRQVQMIFQDPFASLNPVKRIEYALRRPLLIHKIVPPSQAHRRVIELLTSVGLVPAEEFARKYPHQLSGGQRQRVAIARALAVEPSVLLADEPISMLDVSIRMGILNLMLDLKQQRNLAFLYITHDIASARYVADEVLVMYRGQIVERGETEAVLQTPLHPYTRLLLSAVPDPERGLQQGRVETQARTAIVDPAVSDLVADGYALAPGRTGREPVSTGRDTRAELFEVQPGHWVRCRSESQDVPQVASRKSQDQGLTTKN